MIKKNEITYNMPKVEFKTEFPDTCSFCKHNAGSVNVNDKEFIHCDKLKYESDYTMIVSSNLKEDFYFDVLFSPDFCCIKFEKADCITGTINIGISKNEED